MAVHFDFVLDDVDAENLMSLFGSEILRDNEKIMKEMVKVSQGDSSSKDYNIAYKRDITYLKDLKSKITNT